MVKIGDKVRVTTDVYPNRCPRGTVCTVTYVDDYYIVASIDGGSGFWWYFEHGEYEPITITTEAEPENYAEQAAKYGIVVTVRVGVASVTYDGTK